MSAARSQRLSAGPWRRVLEAGVAAAAILAAITAILAAPLAPLGPAPATAATVDRQRLQKRVAAVTAAAYPDLPVLGVRCPKRIARRATCSVTTDGGPTLEMRVTQGRGGTVTIESTQAVIPTTRVVEFVVANSTVPPAVDCGSAPYIVRPPGFPFECTARFPDGTVQRVVLTVDDLAGNVTVTSVG